MQQKIQTLIVQGRCLHTYFAKSQFLPGKHFLPWAVSRFWSTTEKAFQIIPDHSSAPKFCLLAAAMGSGGNPRRWETRPSWRVFVLDGPRSWRWPWWPRTGGWVKLHGTGWSWMGIPPLTAIWNPLKSQEMNRGYEHPPHMDNMDMWHIMTHSPFFLQPFWPWHECFLVFC